MSYQAELARQPKLSSFEDSVTVGSGANVALWVYRQATKETDGPACGTDLQRLLGNSRRLHSGNREADGRCVFREYFRILRLELVGGQAK